MSADTPLPPPPAPVEHLLPYEAEGHVFEDDCPCEPFTYVRYRDGQPVGTEVRHNSFHALPIDDPEG